MIELNNVDKVFINEKKSIIKALSNVNLTLPNSGIVSIVGKSGSGKTTLLNIIAGFLIPSSGQIFIDNRLILPQNIEENNNYRNNYFGYIFQEYNLLEKATVYDNISLALELQKIEKDKHDTIINECLSKLEIQELKDEIVVNLSGGEKQRVAIARSLAKGSKVILADEPTGSLDEKTAEQVLDIFKKISSDILIIMVTHDIEYANKYSDRILKIQNGEIIDDIIVLKKNTSYDQYIPKSVKLKTKDIIGISKKMIFERKKRFVFTVFFWVFSLIFMTTSLSLFFVNDTSILTSAMSQNDIYHAKLINENQLITGRIDPYLFDSVEIVNNTVSNYNISLNNYYYVNDQYSLSDLDSINISNQSEILNAFYDTSLFKYIDVIDSFESDQINDGDIVISDYFASLLIYYGVIDADSPQNTIGKTWEFEGVLFNIKKVIVTNYNQFLEGSSAQYNNGEYNFLTDDLYLTLKNNEFATIYMNSNTFQKVLLSFSKIDCYSGDYEITINKAENLSGYTSDGMIGSLPENDNEIVISMSFLSIVMEEIVTEQNLSSFLGQSYDFEFNYGEKSFTNNMKITGITYSVNSEVFVSDQIYNATIYQIGDPTLFSFTQGTAVTFTNNRIDKNFIDYLQNENILIYSFATNELFFILDSITSFSMIFLVITIVAMIFLVSFIYYFSNNLVIQNKHNLGILMSLGCSRVNASKLIILTSLKMMIYAIVISIPFHYSILIYLNSFIKKQLLIESNVISLAPGSLFISIILSLMISLISIWYPIKNFSRQELINIINDK